MGAGAHETPHSSHCRKMVVRKSEKGVTSDSLHCKSKDSQTAVQRDMTKRERSCAERQELMYVSGGTKQHKRAPPAPTMLLCVAEEESRDLSQEPYLRSTYVLVFPMTVHQLSHYVLQHGKSSWARDLQSRVWAAFFPPCPLTNPSHYSLWGDRGRRWHWPGPVKPTLHKKCLWSKKIDFCWPSVSYSRSFVLASCWWRPQRHKVLTRVFPTLSRAKAQIDCRLWWACGPSLRSNCQVLWVSIQEK